MNTLQRLRTDGYAVVPSVLGAAGLLAWQGVIKHFEPSVARNLLADTAAAELARSDQMRRLIEPVLGESARPVRGLLFDKRPAKNWGVAWHQDTVIAVASRPPESPAGYTAWSEKEGVAHVRPPVGVLERMVTVRLAIDGADASNGALQVMPGSHTAGRLDPTAIDRWRVEKKAVTCVTRSGDALLMRPLLLHASAKATAPRPRRVVHLEFAAEPLPEPLDWPNWAEGLR